MNRQISPEETKQLVHGKEEIAFLDVREHGQYGEGHPLFVTWCPYSRLERLVTTLVPRRDVPVILLDDGNGVAGKAATRLAGLGYSDVRQVTGGAPGWAAAGFTLFKGVNVPSKTLGELAEIAFHTPHITVEDLAGWQATGKVFHLFDARPPTEHRKMALPGAQCLPNGELLHRLDAVVSDPGTPIVVACAGRTRGLIGASGLRLAEVSNPVFALENGTQGWALSGRRLEHGRVAPPYAAMSEQATAGSSERARAFAERHDLPWIDFSRLAELAADALRTTFLLDVRSEAEFSAGSLPGAVHAPGGQLVQSTDQWVGVRHARLVLLDDTGMRASLAAYWLRQLGYEVFVLPDVGQLAGAGVGLPVREAPSFIPLPEIDPGAAIAAAKAGGAILLDLRPSPAFRAGHLAGASWATRARLPDMPPGSCVHLVGDADVTELAAIDLHEHGITAISLVSGNPDSWRAAGLAVETSPNAPDEAAAIDFLFFVHDRHDGNMESARRYLAWEQGLIAQMDAQERAEFAL